MVAKNFITKPKQRKPMKSKAPALCGCPQRRAIVIKSFETTPRKPNSARRRVAKVRLSTKYRLNVYLEGMGSNKLQPHSVVLVRGHGPRDLPGVRYHAIRGVLDFPSLKVRMKGRSKYGVKRLKLLIERKKLRFASLSKTERYRFLRYDIHRHGFKRERVFY